MDKIEISSIEVNPKTTVPVTINFVGKRDAFIEIGDALISIGMLDEYAFINVYNDKGVFFSINGEPDVKNILKIKE